MGAWEADESAWADDCAATGEDYCRALMWVVPARIGGVWTSSQGTLTLEQRFQLVEGTWLEGGVRTPVKGRLRGGEVRFTAGGESFEGRVEGTQLELRIQGREERFARSVAQAAPIEDVRVTRTVPAPAPVIGSGKAVRFALVDGAIRAEVPKERVDRPATVHLPVSAPGAVELQDDVSGMKLRFALRGAAEADVAVADGIALYPGALGGADVVHRPTAEGTEDFVVFEEAPAREELEYSVDVSSVQGLRLVGNALEFLDGGGAPRLRVAPPVVVDASGRRHPATLDVDGCAYDVDPAAPWDRPVIRPGATSCAVRVRWEGVAYPALVDPTWTTTGSMADARTGHTAALLPSGRVLVAGGAGCAGNCAAHASAELYDATTGTFAMTGPMAVPRVYHTGTVLHSGEVLVTGGRDCARLGCESWSSAELYDPQAGSFGPTGSMQSWRASHTASLLASGDVFVAGFGSELYDAQAGTFSEWLPLNVWGDTAATLSSGEVLLAGTRPSGGKCSPPSSAAAVVDPIDETVDWLEMGDGRAQLTASLLPSGDVLIAGGLSATGVTACSEEPVASAELYRPGLGFVPTGSMASPRASHTASVLSTGQVLIAGGMTCGDFPCTPTLFASAELYDAASESFHEAPPMAVARRDHTATVLGSGDVLIAGGVGEDTMALASAELYSVNGQPGAGGSGGAGSAGGSASGEGGNGGGSTDDAGGDGCDCSLAASSPDAPAASWLVPGMLLWIARRRRRRSFECRS